MITAQLPRLSYTKDIFEQSLWALKDNRLRTVLSILGIAIGVMAVIAIGAVSKSGRHLIFSELETFGLKSIWIYRPMEEKDPHRAVRKGTGIDNTDYAAIRAGCCLAIRRASPNVVGGPAERMLIRGENGYSNASIEGVGYESLAINNDDLAMGRPFREQDELRRRRVVILGPKAYADLFGGQQNPLGKEIRIGEDKFLVIGVLQAKDRGFLASIGSSGGRDANNRILIPYTVRQQQLGTKDINFLQAETIGLEQTDVAVSQLVDVLRRNHNDRFSYKTETMAQYIQSANRILQGVSLIGVVAASVSLLVGGMGIMNIMSTAVLERTREIGLRKAIGARRRDILFQFLMESIAISTAGGVLGLALGLIISTGITVITKFPLLPSWLMVAVALIVSVAVGVLSGYYPASRAAAMHPVAALRYE